MQYGAVGLAALLGAGLSVQVGMNAAIRAHAGHAATAAIVNFGVGLVALALFALVARVPVPSGAQLSAVPWWGWLGGLLGAAYVAGATVLGPTIGMAALTGLVVAGQLLAALAIDQLGLFGLAGRPVDAARIAGAVLLVAGAVLLARD